MKRVALLVATLSLTVWAGCDATVPSTDPPPTIPPGPGPTVPPIPEPPGPSLSAETLLHVSATPCRLSGGFSIGFNAVTAYGEGGLAVAATHVDAVTCDGGPSPIWKLGPSGEIESRMSHPFGPRAVMIGARGGFYVVEDIDGQLRLSWMSQKGEVLSRTDIPSIYETNQASRFEVRPVRDASSPTGVSSLWIMYRSSSGDRGVVVLSTEGTVLWEDRSFPWPNVFVPISGGRVLIAYSVGGYVGYPVGLHMVDATGSIVWSQEYVPEAGTWIEVDTVVAMPGGGYWAVGTFGALNDRRLHLIEIDAQGQEIRRAAPLGARSVRGLALAQPLDDDLAVVVKVTGLTPDGYDRTDLLSVRVDGGTLLAETSTLLPPGAGVGQIDMGDGRRLSSISLGGVGCSNGAGGCFGDLGYVVGVHRVSAPR